MDVDSDRGEDMNGDFHGTDEKICCSSNSGPIESNVIDGMDSGSVQNENQSLMVPDEDTESSLILKTLIDDCLKEAFLRLNFLDLLNVVKVCKRFEVQAKEAFASKYKYLHLDVRQCDQEAMLNILSVFGSSIRALEINFDRHAADGNLLHAIIQHCSSNLKLLGLENFDFHVDAPNMRLPFPELTAFGLFGCTGNLDLAHLVNECTNLEQILLVGCNLPGVNQMISCRFEKLKELKMTDCTFDVDTDALEHFIMSNHTLTVLKLSTFEIRTSHAIRLIGKNMLKLQSLYLALSCDSDSLQDFQSDVERIGRLRSLEELLLDFNDLDVAPLAKALATNNVPIRILGIFYGFFDDTAVEHISRLTKITNLLMTFVDDLKEGHLITLAGNLHELQEMHLRYVSTPDGSDVLTIDGLVHMLHHAKQLSQLELILLDNTDFVINERHYKIMLDTIRKRPGKNSLCIDIEGKKCKLNVPEVTLQENADILSIKIREK